MHPIQNAGGHVGITAREYPIATNTNIKQGQVVKLSGGKVVAAAAAETGAILGIAAENHSGVVDALDIRANGPVIMVSDSPELIFECNAPEFAAAGGSATTVTATSGNVACATADAFNGGKLKLKSKILTSTNTDAVGNTRDISDYAQASGTSTFTVNSAGAANSGDVYYLFPPIGATSVFSLDSNISGVVATAAGCSKIRVVGWDLERNKLKLMAVEHALGVEN